MQKIKKLIAAMLVVLLLTEMLPLQVFAEEVSIPGTGMVEEVEAAQAEEEGPHEMLAEITEKRDADTKHFLNSDGTYTAVKYSQPVHYQESPDSEWVDINNTLVLTNAEKAPGVKRARRAGSGAYPQSGSEVYVPTDSPIDVVFAKDTSGMYLATLNYGDYTLSWQYAVRYAVTEDEETAGSNDAIVEEPSGEEEDPAGEEISATEEETTGEDEETTGEESMPPEEPATTEEFVTEEATTEDETPAVEETAITEDGSLEESSIPATRIEEAALARVAAQSLELESDPTQKNTVEQQAVKSVTDGLIYRDVAPDVDLEYVLNSIYLKENVVLKSPEAAHEFLLTYHIGELKAKQISEQEIALKAEDGTIVYTIYAPYMIDADRTVSTGVSLTIVSVADGQLVAVLTADGEWLSDSARNYPVKIDPYISQGVTSHLLSNAQNATARQYSSGGVPYGSLVIGNDYGASYGKTRVYIKFELPELQAGDVVINGQMGLVQYNDTYGYDHVQCPELQVNVHKVMSAWTDANIWYSSGLSGLPAIGGTVEDYRFVSDKTCLTRVIFDISKLVKEWYNNPGTNYGVCLKAANESDYAVAKFLASYMENAEECWPTLYVTYLNNQGLEGRWTTHTQDLGRSGVGYTDDYTGNLVYIAPVVATTGNNMPVSISLVYNGYQHGNAVNRPNTVGQGWRLNIQEMVTPIVNDESKPLMKKLYDNGFRYIYEDGDGTAHYFREKDGSTSEFEDEEGMGLTLKKNSDNTYEISSDTGGKMTFTSAGYLSKVYNTNGKNYEVCYDGVKIQSILDGAGRRITVTSDRDGQITSMTDPSNRVTSFDYTNSGALELITYPDGKWTKFSYDSNKRMSWAWGTDRRWVQYEYPSSGSEAVMNRVTRVTEYGSDDSVGNWLSMDYSAMNQTKFTDNRGRTEVYQFDNMGRTVSIRDADGGYQSYKYVFGGEKNNKTANALKSANVGEHFVCNLLKNHSFEQSDSNWTFTPNGDDSSGNVWVYSADSIPTENTYLGRKSACLSNGAQITQKTSVPSSKVYYSLSAYVKTDSSAANATLSIEFMNSSNSVIKTATSNPVNYTTDWQRICISAGAPENTAKIRVCCKANGTGTAWFDCVQLEQGDGASAYNLVEDSGFQASSGLWSATGSQGSNEGIQGGTNKYYRIAGSASQEKQVRQQIYIGRSASTTFFSISGRAWADSVPVNDKEERYFGLGLCAHFTDGTEDVKRVSFNAAYSADWQYASDTIGFSGDKTIEYVYAFFSYGKNANAVYFDDLQVNLDAAGTTYSYDKEGNLISAKDNAGRHQTFNYNSANELTKIKTADNKNYTYEYDSTNKHQLNSATSLSSGIKISLEYDQFGNVTSSTARHVSGGGKFIKQETQYTADGNYMASSQNDRGSTTTYDYNSLKGTLNSVTDPNQSTTYYTYDPNNDRLLSVSDQSNASSGSATTVGYGYNGERLQTITTPSTQYGFTYDTYGNSEAVSAGNQTLVTNTYNDQNGTLRSRAYGNGGTVSYSYVFLDRPAYQKYNDVTRYSWGYNAVGQLAGFWDYVSGKTYTYTYDLLGRMERMDVSDGSWIACAYNNIDQSTGLRYRYADVTQNIGYAYSDRDNLPLSTTFSDYGTVTNEYDTLTRLTHRNYTLAGSGTLRTSYDYLDWTTDANRTTGTVDGICYTYSPGGLTLPDLAYSYDANGNITEIRGGSALDPDTLRQHLKNGTAIPQSMSGQENYSYDAKGQLTRHDSATQNASFTYSYDKAGNITAVSKYAYTTGTLGTALETKNYTYATGAWGDLLTNYNDKAISYDAIGNMTSYDGATFTWEGRSLASLSKGGSSYSYQYNADGIRTGKTVNGTVTEYFLSGSQILAQKTGNSVMWFFYDSQGTRTGLVYDGHFYYYLYNVQGDVVALADSANGQLVARYDYDAWGRCTVTNATGNTVGDDNPFRYRGYYYDTDTGLYYLKSRYYDPELRRFISSDIYVSTGQGLLGANMFTYCNNNPVVYSDPNGKSLVAAIIIGAVVGGVIGGGSAYLKGGDTKDIVLGTLAGAASGGFCGAGNGWIFAGAAVSGIYKATTSEGNILERGAKGLAAFWGTLAWGELGNIASKELGDLTSQVVGNFLFNLEFGIAAEGVTMAAEACVDYIFSKQTPQTTNRQMPVTQGNFKRQIDPRRESQ